MANVFDYLKWRDDLPLTEINPVDVLIFNRMSYFPLEKIMSAKEKMTVKDAYLKLITLDIHINKQDKLLFTQLKDSHRYQNLVISDVVSKMDIEKEEQFMAITIHLPKNMLYIAFRGTTNHIIGWKENFNMSYMTVFSQLDALNYLNRVNISKRIYVGGHSKGGNLAIYASSHANRLVKSRIVKVYNYDGPGFVDLDENYYSINKKIVSYIPGFSVVGRLLNLDNEVVVVESDAKGLMEHNLYTWQVDKNDFLLGKLKDESDKLKKLIDDFLLKVSPLKRQEMVNELFDFLQKAGINSLKDINFSTLKDLLMSYRNLSDKEKKKLITIMKMLSEGMKIPKKEEKKLTSNL